MARTGLLYAAVTSAALGIIPAAAFAAGPCSNQIAQLGKQLSQQNGLGAPVSEPGAGQNVSSSPEQSMNGKMAATAGSAADARTGGKNPMGTSAGTAGGVAGTTGAAAGTETAQGIASGQIATSPADVRRQSEGLPTAAQAAANHASGTGGQGNLMSNAATKADKVSMAKSDLQNATTLSAKGDKSCMRYIQHARSMMKGT